MTKSKYYHTFFLMSCVCVFSLTLGAHLLPALTIPYLPIAGTVWSIIVVELNVLSALACVGISALLLRFFLSHGIRKGGKYFWRHVRISARLKRQLEDAGFAVKRERYVEIPWFQLGFSDDLSTGFLKIRNTIKLDRKLDDAVINAALGYFVVENRFTSCDGNYYMYELVDGRADYKLVFPSAHDFSDYADEILPNQWFLDARTQVPLCHTLIVGQTGSGKTYAMLSLILQLRLMGTHPEVSFVDLKASTVGVIGRGISPHRTAKTFDQAVEQIRIFHREMGFRKQDMEKLLESNPTGDYNTFRLPPHVMIIDEYASFAQILKGKEKKLRDEVMALLYEIVLQGRQLGFFLMITMQKSDATLIDTALRDNIPLKIVLGQSEDTTYITCFGSAADVPMRKYARGEGVFTHPELTRKPRLVQFPELDFDILGAL